MTHYELCKKTAEKFLKDSKIVLFEYQTVIMSEFPDVLCFKGWIGGGGTTLYEIKVDHHDFKKDSNKECRIEYKVKYFPRIHQYEKKIRKFIFGNPNLKELIIEKPHLGRFRYYVCPWGLINPDEVKNGWGLYYFKNNKFYKKKDSKTFKNNIYDEMNLIIHAFRKYSSESTPNVLINRY